MVYLRNTDSVLWIVYKTMDKDNSKNSIINSSSSGAIIIRLEN